MFSTVYPVKLAFRNVFRNKRRSLLTTVVIMFSVGTFLFMLSYLEGFTKSVIEDSIKATGHLNVQHPEYKLKERMLSLTVPVENYEQVKGAISGLAGVKAATGRIKFGGLIDFRENNEPGLGMGIDIENERDVLNIENSIIEGSYFSGGEKETIIGLQFAQKLNINIGDTITVISSTAYSSLAAENLVVVGIADMLSSMLNRLFYLPLTTAQTLLDMDNMVSELVVFLENKEDLPEIQKQISSLTEIRYRYSVIGWLEKGDLKNILPLVNIVLAIMIILFGIISAFSIINTMLMAVFERTSEIGVFTAFGMKRRNVLAIFLSESFVIGLCGGLLGIIVGSLGGYWLETTGLTIGEIVEDFPIPIRQTIYGDLKWIHVVIAYSMGLVLSTASAFLPALKAARLEPTDALRRQ